MTDQRIESNGLAWAPELHQFITTEALPGSGVDAERFFERLQKMPRKGSQPLFGIVPRPPAQAR